MGPWVIKALNFVLVGASCFLVAGVVTEIGGEAIEPPPISNEVHRIESGDAVAAASPSAILDRNLFGAQLAGEAQIVNTSAAASDETLEATKLPLRLLGTAAARDVDRSRAAIQDEKTRKHIVVAVGDELAGHTRVRVRDIRAVTRRPRQSREARGARPARRRRPAEAQGEEAPRARSPT